MGIWLYFQFMTLLLKLLYYEAKSLPHVLLLQLQEITNWWVCFFVAVETKKVYKLKKGMVIFYLYLNLDVKYDLDSGIWLCLRKLTNYVPIIMGFEYLVILNHV